MSRRAVTQSLTVVLTVLLAIAGAMQTVPYVVLSPGPAYDTLGTVGGSAVLTIKGRTTYATDGALALTTVEVSDHVTLVTALEGWVSRNAAVVPREVVFPADQSRGERDKENAQQMQDSQDAATTAALRELGLPFTTDVSVREIAKGAPADGRLQVGDVITHVDGRRITDTASLRRLIGTRDPGDDVEIGFLRKGRPGTATMTTIASQDARVRPVVGVSLSEASRFPVTVEISLREVGGPSAGLMFALGILEKLGKESLTGGRIIAGTGEITADGTVQAIGGIAQKMRGAKQSGATVFLSPAGNCDEARRAAPDGLVVVKVGTLKQALAALEQLRKGGTPPTC